jgi:hypothetical protein
MLVVMAGPALAQDPLPHDHSLIVSATGTTVQVGPHRCELGATVQGAFPIFHFKVHVGANLNTDAFSISASLC